MKFRRVMALLALALSLVAFLAPGGLASAQGQTITIQLGEQNNSGQTGTAQLTDLGNGTTRVVVDLQNSPAGPQPVHIHRQTCANLDPAVLFPLTSLMNGRSESTVPAALSTILGAPHAINAHKSPQEAQIYVSCGNITAGAAAMPRAGGGFAAQSAALSWLASAGLLAVAVVGAAYALRRRQA